MVYLSIMKRVIAGIWILFFLFHAGIVAGQTEAEIEAAYAKRIQLDIIDGVYIPSDFEDAFAELNRLGEAKAIAYFKNAPEDSIRRKLHFGLGRWILMNWGFEDGSRFSHYLKLKGISVPDDMVEIVILAWHRHLNGKPLALEPEIALIEERRAKERAAIEAAATKTVIDKRPHKE